MKNKMNEDLINKCMSKKRISKSKIKNKVYNFIYYIFLVFLAIILIVNLCGCANTTTFKVKTESIDLGEVKFNKDLEKLELEPIKTSICKKNTLCLDKQNAINLTENIIRMKKHIRYLKEIYLTDINTCESIINKKYH